jgi:hypothetical protein
LNWDGVLTIVALAGVAWAVIAEMRNIALQSQLAFLKQKGVDEKIEARDHLLTKPELDALLTKELGPGDLQPPTVPVPKPGPKGSDN